MKSKHTLILLVVVMVVILSWWFFQTSRPSNTLQVEKQSPALQLQNKPAKMEMSSENIQPETKPAKAGVVDSAISDIDEFSIEEQFQDILGESTSTFDHRDYVYPPYSQHNLADGGKAKKFVGEVLENFKGVTEIRFSADLWQSGGIPGEDEPDITDVTVIIRGNDLIGERDGYTIFMYVEGLRMLYKNGNPTPYHIDKTEECAPIKIQAMLQRFPWDSMRKVLVQQDNGEGSIVEKEFVEVSSKLSEARALIDPETMELRKLDYVQEAKEGEVSQYLPMQMEYCDYVDIKVFPDRTVRFPSRLKSVFNETRYEQFVFKDFTIKMDSNSTEDQLASIKN